MTQVVECDQIYKQGSDKRAYCNAQTEIKKLQSTMKTVPTVKKVLFFIFCILAIMLVGTTIVSLLFWWSDKSPGQPRPSYAEAMRKIFSNQSGKAGIAVPIMLSVLIIGGFAFAGFVIALVSSSGKPWADKPVPKTDEEQQRDAAEIQSIIHDERFKDFSPLSAE